MLEIEMKYPVETFAAVEEYLEREGPFESVEHTEIDRYFNAPDRDFGQTDEALRLRSVGETSYVTYKGPKTDPQSKTRAEIEVPLGGGYEARESFQRLLQCLGYRFTAEVNKDRRVFRMQHGGFDLAICMDEVQGVGRFVELEIVAPEQELESARSVLLHVAEQLQLKNSERRSYLEMLIGEDNASRQDN